MRNTVLFFCQTQYWSVYGAQVSPTEELGQSVRAVLSVCHGTHLQSITSLIQPGGQMPESWVLAATATAGK